MFFHRYGDKTPKSNIARVVSVMWILTGVISMAVFVAHVTSVLTSYTLEQDDVTIKGKKVGRQRERSPPRLGTLPPIKKRSCFSPMNRKIFSSVLAPKSITKGFYSVLQCTNHFWNKFFVLSFLLLFSSDFRCVTVPVFRDSPFYLFVLYLSR